MSEMLTGVINEMRKESLINRKIDAEANDNEYMVRHRKEKDY